MDQTGFCWNCGRQLIGEAGYFCNKKCQEQYERKQNRQIRKGKRAGYGLAGSTH